MTPHDLAAWAERAKPEEQRAVLEAAYNLRYGGLPADIQYLHASRIAFNQDAADHAEHFTVMLDAEAYESAALMLVPDGAAWKMQTDFGLPGRASIYSASKDNFYTTDASTPALALIAACARAAA